MGQRKKFTDNERALWERTEVGDWLDCEFLDGETEEMFFVEEQKQANEELADFVNRCRATAKENFNHPIFTMVVSTALAEFLGYDTY